MHPHNSSARLPTPTSNATDLQTQVSTALQARYSLSPSPTWLSTFLSTVRHPPPPLPALTSTAHFRLLSSDFTASLTTSTPSTLLSPTITDPSVKQTTLAGNVPLQVLDVEDIGTSRWSQIESLERIERGEEIRGREVIRTLPVDATDSTTTVAAEKSAGPHKLMLQDARGTKVSAFERERIPKLGLGDEGMAIGMKIVVKQGAVVRRGVLMLRPEDVVVLGGKIEAWDKKWREGRIERLRTAIGGEAGA